VIVPLEDEQTTMFGPMKDTPDDAHLIYEAEAKKKQKKAQNKQRKQQQQQQQQGKAEGRDEPQSIKV